jgi:hypothetical protein
MRLNFETRQKRYMSYLAAVTFGNLFYKLRARNPENQGPARTGNPKGF